MLSPLLGTLLQDEGMSEARYLSCRWVMPKQQAARSKRTFVITPLRDFRAPSAKILIFFPFEWPFSPEARGLARLRARSETGQQRPKP
jgi:hypothetical protein